MNRNRGADKYRLQSTFSSGMMKPAVTGIYGAVIFAQIKKWCSQIISGNEQKH
jgi:hypothetical protein